MSFGIGNNKVSLNALTLEDLTKGLDPKKDKKKIEQIKVAFNFFNKPGVDGKKDDSLSYEEQIAMLNFMNQADGAPSDRDGEVTRSGLRRVARENGIKETPKYKEYESFINAYQKALAEMSPADTAEIGYSGQGKFAVAQFTDDAGTVREVYTSDINTPVFDSGTIKDKNGNTFKTDNIGRIVQQTVNGIKTQYVQFASDTDPTPTIVRQDGLTYHLDDGFDKAGLYVSENGDDFHAARMGTLGNLIPVETDDKGRITKETIGDTQFSYTFEGDSDNPVTITTTKPGEGEPEVTTFTKEGELYTTGTEGNKKYFTYSDNEHQFTPAEAPKAPIVKPKYSRHERVHQTAVWKNQRLGEAKAQELGLNDLNTAEEVLDKLINSDESLKDKKINREQLLADFIKNNPSVFVSSGDSKGVIFSDAKWARLDFPKDLRSYITE